ncbi:helix-turn-helix transcriptional regulator [Candidatus Enterococcus murrayae]|uniref:YafY family transcriptional regulator n=1 Tax=Candidatus Enterococcus murrayae TaxID=2815321 RepID=A0ABS3HCZ1_9ENTE|nr:YafY family protein [Enterococcus sp. MJM16]MBO0451317.1 YafY family transcriptional regulator [Enterococcus sp. MJM16]
MKTERLLAITMLLIEKKQISAPALAEIFEVSVRTIYRDIDSLSQAGIPVTALPGSKGGIRIMENYKIDQSFFTSADLISLLIGLNSIPSEQISKQAKFTLEKLKTLIPNEAEQEINDRSSQLIVDLSPWTSTESSPPFFKELQEAIHQRQLVSFEYANRSGQKTTRIIEPYRLILKEISWYIQGYCHEKKDFRIFKLIRMENLHVLQQRFDAKKVPEADLGKDVAHQFITIHLEVDFFVKDQLTDRFGQLNFIPIENSQRFSVQFPFIPDEFGYHLLLGFGTRCKCIAPEFVKTELKRRIQRMMATYSGE